MSRWATGFTNALTLLFAVLTVVVGVGTLAVAGGALEPPLFKPDGDSSPPTVAVLVSPTAAPPTMIAQSATGVEMVPVFAPTFSPTPLPTGAPAGTLTGTSMLAVTLAPVIPATATRTPLPTRGAGQPSPTPTATPTFTPSPSASPAPFGPSPTPTPVLPFILQPGTPLLRSNFANAEGCEWEGIAGQVVNTMGDPVLGIRVMVSGDTFETQTVESGTNDDYGPSGWEVAVSTQPDNGWFWVMLMAEDGAPLSPVAEIVFPAACQQNLALVNFVQIRPF